MLISYITLKNDKNSEYIKHNKIYEADIGKSNDKYLEILNFIYEEKIIYICKDKFDLFESYYDAQLYLRKQKLNKILTNF
jgi:hypothetical protein